MTEVLLEIKDQVANLSLNRPGKKNALTRLMWQDLAAALHSLPGRARVLILRTTGDDFCAGADIQELQTHIHDSSWITQNHAQVQATQLALQQLPMPSIAVIHGACFGGGVGLATACDFRIASNLSKFALTPAKLGLSYSVADTHRLISLIGPARARELLFTGVAIPAVQALTYGLIHQMQAINTIDSAVQQLTAALLENSPSAIAAMKTNLLLIANGTSQDDASAKQRFASAFDSPDFAEGAAAFLEKRKAAFGANLPAKSV